MTWVEVEIGGRVHRVPAMKYQGRLWFHWHGETHVIDTQAGARRAGGGRGTTHPGVIAAPMPGRVMKIFVKAGDPVQKGQALVVMEAMKMEYTLEADREGVVQELKAKEGAQVALGEILVRLGDSGGGVAN